MAHIRPLRAWRYNDELITKIEDLTSPLFDVVSDTQRKELYKNPLNSIHLSVPMGDNPQESARSTIKKWKKEGILVQDPLPGLYVYFQHFRFPGSDKNFTRKGFIGNLQIYDWHEKMLLRHENTMPFSVEDRMQVLHYSQMNVAPTHGLFTDVSEEIESYLDQAMLHPIYETEDYQGVRDVLAVIHDVPTIRRILEIMADKPIILADGHHRYESSLIYRNKRRATNPGHTGQEGYNYHLMYFTNTEAEDLRILPTHRLLNGLKDFNSEKILDKLATYFNLRIIDNPSDLYEVILGKQWAFGLLIGDNAYKLRLKPEMMDTMSWKFPDAIKQLELTIMHYFIIEKVLGIMGNEQRNAKEITFERNYSECIRKAAKGDCQMALITQEISIDTVKKVCYSGFTLPQKSTYFYPKVIGGFVFGSIDESEFYSNFDRVFE